MRDAKTGVRHPNVRDDLSGTITGFSEDAKRLSTSFLKAVEDTVDTLTRCENQRENLANLAFSLAEAVFNKANNSPENPIDPDDTIADNLASALETFSTELQGLESKRTAALKDPDLNGDHEDNIVCCYDRIIDRTKRLQQAISELYEAVREHDANGESATGQRFASAEDLIAALND